MSFLTNSYRFNGSPAIEKYYDFKIVTTDATPLPVMDGLGALSYDYLNTGSRGLLTVCGWPAVSIKSIYYDQAGNGTTFVQQTDFPGEKRHVFGLYECSDGSLFLFGGDKNEPGFEPRDCWRYTKNVTPGLEGTWTLITLNMGSVWGNRIMFNSWYGGDGFIYAAFGQFDNAGTPFYDVIKIPELTVTGTDWTVVADYTSFFATNSITSLSNSSVSFANGNAILTGGGLYTGAFVTNIYNNKVIKLSSNGTVATVQGTLESHMYCNGAYYDNKHFVQIGADNTGNHKGLFYSDDLGVTWTENYDASKATHASTLFIHNNKLTRIAGNGGNGVYTYEATPYPATKPHDWWLRGWLLNPTKYDVSQITAFNAMIDHLETNGQLSKIEAFYTTFASVSEDQRMHYIFRNRNFAIGQDDQDYGTYDRIQNNSASALGTGNGIYYQFNGSTSVQTKWNLVDDAINSDGENCSTILFPWTDIKAGNRGDVGGYSGGIGNYMFLSENINGVEKYYASQSNILVKTTTGIPANRYHAVGRNSSNTHVEFVQDTNITSNAAAYDDAQIAADEILGGAGSLLGGNGHPYYIRATGDLDHSVMKAALVILESGLSIVR
jgi:hypothetical protein